MQLVKLNKTRKTPSSKGDTIVEVLIALTVLSMAIGIGFSIVGSSNKGLQANKEQFQAQQLANRQIEYLRSSNAGNRNSFSAAESCLLNNGTVVTGAPNCKDAAAAMGGASIYTVDISCVDASGNSGAVCSTSPTQISTYSVVVTWNSVKGTQSRLELQYAM